ncbi:unnamed protein product [Phaeothamnion confervicola]
MDILEPRTLRLLLRKGPGRGGIDFNQTVPLDVAARAAREKAAASLAAVTQQRSVPSSRIMYVTPPLPQEFETLRGPSGLLLQIVLHSTHGDPYYIGLQRLEVCGMDGRPIPLRADQIWAAPHSLRDLGQPDDPRVPANLVRPAGICGGDGGDCAWLAPMASSLLPHGGNDNNVIYVAFDTPVRIGCLNFFNYSKTPARGVRDFSVLLDGRLLFRGALRLSAAPPGSGASAAGMAAATGAARSAAAAPPVLFTNDVAVVRAARPAAAARYAGVADQDLLCIDERTVGVRSSSMFAAPDPAAEGVWFSAAHRPTTAVGKLERP